jgi:Trk K+ transport system NAD-binding subunit
LHRAGALGVIYAHLISLPRINRIKNLAQRKKKMAEQQVRAGKQAAGKQSLDFSLEDDELIKFDF